MSPEFPTEDVELTHLLVVADVTRSCAFYTDVLGAQLFREYGGTSAVLQFQGKCTPSRLTTSHSVSFCSINPCNT